MAGPDEREATTGRHPIGVVSSRTGLPQDVLRAWERRYAAVSPHRTETGRRLYSDRDLEKLRLLKIAVETGRRISDVASLGIGELAALVQEDAAAVPGARSARRTAVGEGRAAGQLVQEALSAVEGLDGVALESVLRRATVELSPQNLRNEVIRPLLELVGRRWRAGSLRIANEHLATAVVRSFLGALRLNGHAARKGATVIVSTPSGHRHELGALLAAIAALEVGWDAVYLGPDLPAAEIVAAVRHRDARAVALSVVSPANDPRTIEELRRLRDHLGDTLPIFVGGQAAESYDPVLAEIGARRVDEPHVFQSALESL